MLDESMSGEDQRHNELLWELTSLQQKIDRLDDRAACRDKPSVFRGLEFIAAQIGYITIVYVVWRLLSPLF